MTLNDLFEAAERRGARRERERVRMRRRKTERRELARRILGTRCACGSTEDVCFALREPGTNDSWGISERGWLCRRELFCGEMAMRVAMCRACLSRRIIARLNDERRDPIATSKRIRACLGIV